MPTRQSFIVEMVGKADLPNAIALNSTMFNSARMIGPAVGGLLVALTGEGWCFLINGLSFLGVLTGLAFMTTAPPPGRRRPMARAASSRGSPCAARTEPFRSLLLLVALLSVTGMSFTVLLPLFADQLQGGPDGYGLLMGAVGMGALAGAIRLALQHDSSKLNFLPGHGGSGHGHRADPAGAGAVFLDGRRGAAGNRLLPDHHDGGLQYAAAEPGARRPARAGDGLLHDVLQRAGAVRHPGGRRAGPPHRRAAKR